jgi:hypothetical protein
MQEQLIDLTGVEIVAIANASKHPRGSGEASGTTSMAGPPAARLK